MKRSLVPLFASCVLVAGCASTGVDQAGSVAADMRTIVVELDKGRAAIDASIASLDQLNTTGGDVKAKYKQYSDSLDALDTQSKRLQSLRADMKSKQDSYVADWQKRQALITSPELRQRSEARKEELAKRFADTSAKADETRTKYDAMYKQLRDIQKYLENDLTANGLTSVGDTAKSAKRNSVDVKEGIAKISDNIKQIANDIDVPPPPPPAPPTAPAK